MELGLNTNFQSLSIESLDIINVGGWLSVAGGVLIIAGGIVTGGAIPITVGIIGGLGTICSGM